jgi:hypothetical protein
MNVESGTNDAMISVFDLLISASGLARNIILLATLMISVSNTPLISSLG